MKVKQILPKGKRILRQIMLTKQMKSLGYTPTHVKGFSNDFVMWQSENGDVFGFDDWSSVQSFIDDVSYLMFNHNIKELEDMINEFIYDNRTIETAINNYPKTLFGSLK